MQSNFDVVCVLTAYTNSCRFLLPRCFLWLSFNLDILHLHVCVCVDESTRGCIEVKNYCFNFFNLIEWCI